MTFIVKKEQKEINVIEGFKCNSCKREFIKTKETFNLEYAEILVFWGYESNKDCEAHRIHFCEECYDKMLKVMDIEDMEKINYCDGELDESWTEDVEFVEKLDRKLFV